MINWQLATGRKTRILTVVDTFSRNVAALDAKFNYKREDVVMALDRSCRQVGYPKTIRVDNGSEFISRDMDLWVYQPNVTLTYDTPENPLITLSPGPSTASSVPSASTRIGSWGLKIRSKSWRLGPPFDCCAINCRAVVETTTKNDRTAQSGTRSQRD